MVVLWIKVLIVLCLIIGFEEIYFMLIDVKLLVWLFGLLYFLIMLLFLLVGLVGLVLLFLKWCIVFGELICIVDYVFIDVDDLMVMFELID